MAIPTEPIGSIPRPPQLQAGMEEFNAGRLSEAELWPLIDAAIRDTVEQFEATGSPVITDGEQAKPSFVGYPIHGLKDLAPEGVTLPFADGHTRQLPRLTAGPFRYQTYAATYLEWAKKYAHVPVKQAVIAPSALSLIYPQEGIPGYPREAFLEDLMREAETDIRECLGKGAHNVQMDFTEGRLSVKLDPSKQVLKAFIDLNNAVLGRFSEDERKRIGVHTCPGGDKDSTHSLDVDYGELLPLLFQLNVGTFYMQLASEPDRPKVLRIVKEHLPADRRIFLGVIDPIDPRVETPQEVRERILEASDYIPVDRLGTCDDCGFSPFGDDVSTARRQDPSPGRGNAPGGTGSRGGVRTSGRPAPSGSDSGRPNVACGSTASPGRRRGSSDVGVGQDGQKPGPWVPGVEALDASVGPKQGALDEVLRILVVAGCDEVHPVQELDLRKDVVLHGLSPPVIAE